MFSYNVSNFMKYQSLLLLVFDFNVSGKLPDINILLSVRSF